METILYKPLFINPQAYYVFPNINGRLEPKTGSGKEPAIFVGNIEVKTIAHGDIGKKQYFYNTNEIDLSAFSNSLVRISLYTSRGNVVLGEWNLDVVEGESEDYIDPEVLASLVAVCICDGKSNDDPDRAVIKNLVDPDNPFVISNAAYKLNSGYGKYEEDFTIWRKINPIDSISSDSFYAVNIAPNLRTMLVRNHNTGDEMPQWKVMVSGLKGEIIYILRTESGNIRHQILSEGINILEKSYAYAGDDVVGFAFYPGASATITQIPSFEGALVTDGKDDLITSTKTVQEMLGGSNEVTVVSMIHQIGLSSLTTINNIRSESVAHLVCRNICSSAGKTGIYGYSRQINTNNPPTLINNILGDKKDYTAEGNSALDPTDKFFVQGYKYRGTIDEMSPIAYYWTFIANKVLTTDQINQVISYFNLDKHVKPDVYYDVKKQGLSNDTPKVDWYLKDFSGNGHDMTLYNFAKKLGSEISKYEEDFTTWRISKAGIVSTINVNSIHVTRIGASIGERLAFFEDVTTTNKKFNIKLKISGLTSDMKCTLNNRNSIIKELVNGVNEISVDLVIGWYGFTIIKLDGSIIGDCDITIEQIPDYEGALVSDGVEDYGKVENLPIYKDYTVVADREIVDGLIDNANGGVATRSYNYAKGAFGFDWKNQAFSFGGNTDRIIDVQRFISYQSKYINNGIQLITGNVVDNNPLYMARLGEENRYSKLALWSFLLFPYTLSEFLLERQLKRYKLGTLYPDMIEWRPIAKSNIPYKQIDYFIKRSGTYVRLNPGDYFQSTEDIIVRVTLIRDWQLDVVSSIKVNGKNEVISVNSSYTQTAPIHIDKSPQKIDITIDEYIRYEDIVQPYPAIINLKQDGKTITWGDKLKVGSDIVFVGSANLLPELYTVSETRYNGVTLYPNTIIKVEKSMVFDNARTYLKANEPSCILSPNRLRIPNSSYKILGYIPDLTGKGNHGVINNSAYAGMSGANRYKYDWNTYTSHIAGVKPTANAFKVNLTAETSTIALFSTPIFTVGSKSHYFRFKISGLINNQKIQIDYPKGSNDTVITSDRFGNGEYSTKDYTVGEVKRLNFYVINAVKGEPISVSIEQLPEYESSFCLDGVDDFVTIPTLAHGAKQVLMKVNLQSYDRYLYDQRNNWSQYLAIVSASKTIAYEYSNKGGKTYIDGILNEHIIDKDLLNITHNITATNANIGVQYAPNIGTSFARGNFAQMALFDFMLFPEISSEDEIKELNDIIGIEGNTDDLLTKINI